MYNTCNLQTCLVDVFGVEVSISRGKLYLQNVKGNISLFYRFPWYSGMSRNLLFLDLRLSVCCRRFPSNLLNKCFSIAKHFVFNLRAFLLQFLNLKTAETFEDWRQNVRYLDRLKFFKFCLKQQATWSKRQGESRHIIQTCSKIHNIYCY